MRTRIVKSPLAELNARLPELTLRDQHRLRRRLGRARKLRGAEARQAAVAEVAAEVDAAERRVGSRTTRGLRSSTRRPVVSSVQPPSARTLRTHWLSGP